LVAGIKGYLKIKLQGIREYYPDWKYIEIEIEIKNDHIHLHMLILPKYNSKHSSRNYKKEYQWISKKKIFLS